MCTALAQHGAIYSSYSCEKHTIMVILCRPLSRDSTVHDMIYTCMIYTWYISCIYNNNNNNNDGSYIAQYPGPEARSMRFTSLPQPNIQKPFCRNQVSCWFSATLDHFWPVGETKWRLDRVSNPRPSDHKTDALPLRHRVPRMSSMCMSSIVSSGGFSSGIFLLLVVLHCFKHMCLLIILIRVLILST